MRLVLAVLAVAGCYHSPTNADCEITCGAGGACPPDLKCVNGFCVADGQVCVDPSLVLAYSFDDVGTTLTDDSGHANTGLVRGTPAATPAQHGNGLRFAKPDQYIAVPNSASLDIGEPLTIAFWVTIEPDDMVDDVIVAKLWTDGQQGLPPYQWAVEVNSDEGPAQSYDFYIGDAQMRDVGPFRIPAKTGVPQHVAFSYDGDLVEAHLDGVPQSIAVTDPQVTTTISLRGQSMQIGVDGNHAQPFHGVLDNLRIYHRVLTTPEVRADMMTPAR